MDYTDKYLEEQSKEVKPVVVKDVTITTSQNTTTIPKTHSDG